jgi:hypothetical protein
MQDMVASERGRAVSLHRAVTIWVTSTTRVPARTDRQSVRAETVTHVSGLDPTDCSEVAMFDFDPGDYDSGDDERQADRSSRGGRSGSSDRDDNWSQPEARTRDRDGDDARSLGRGPGNERQGSDQDARSCDHDPRWTDHDRDGRERDRETRDAFTRHVHLPLGPERELVRDRDREYTPRGSESRTLATVGAFRVVSSRDLRDHDGSPPDPRSGDLRHLREQGATRSSTGSSGAATPTRSNAFTTALAPWSPSGGHSSSHLVKSSIK